MSRKRNIQDLGDFTTTPRVIPISLLAIVIGTVCAYVALGLLRLIGLVTNLAYFHRWSSDLVSPAGNHLGIYGLFVPIGGGLIIGLIARYGSERIRGHGIPEAIEAILMNGSRVQPRVGILKALSSAISIGTGGPFGAEGPIIMTGGSFGSVIAQFFHLTAAERKTLLVAGAAAGMSATFAHAHRGDTPRRRTAALRMETPLLHSRGPRQRHRPPACFRNLHLLRPGPAVPRAAASRLHRDERPARVRAGRHSRRRSLGAAHGRGVWRGGSLLQHLPIHWMWWPAIGGLVIGLGGLVFPQALGVGYDTIGSILGGNAPRNIIIGVLLVKPIIWAFSLGSGHIRRRAGAIADDGCGARRD